MKQWSNGNGKLFTSQLEVKSHQIHFRKGRIGNTHKFSIRELSEYNSIV